MRHLPRLETHPRVVALARTWAGKALLVGALALLLWPLLYSRTLAAPVPLAGEWLCVAAVAVATLVPRRRRLVIALAGVVGLGLGDRAPTGWFAVNLMSRVLGVAPPEHFMLIALVLALAFCTAFAYLATRYADARLFKRPVTLLLVAYLGACVVAAYLPLSAELTLWCWAGLIAMGRFVWFLGYTLLERRSRNRTALPIQVGSYIPFWGSTNTPYPKGAAYLTKIEVTNAEELAVWQLKGLKLLWWAIVLSAIRVGFMRVVHGQGPLVALLPQLPSLHVPYLEAALVQTDNGVSISIPMRWLILSANLIEEAFLVAIPGHVYIGICRMTGFKALRNTYRPFSSLTIAEFFNRFYYYFKELMLDFFFFPTYLRYFKKRPKLRLFFATFAAAGFGNALYHYLRDIHYIALMGPWHALTGFSGYLLYCAILGLAVGLSQLRGARPPSTWLGRLGARASVFVFFAVLLVFNDPKRTVGLGRYLRFVAHLVVPS